MKVNYDFVLKDLEGNIISDENGKDIPAYKAAANMILNSQAAGSDVMKRFRWAQELYQAREIDLDRAGQEDFKNALQNAPGVSLLVRGLLLEPLMKDNNG